MHERARLIAIRDEDCLFDGLVNDQLVADHIIVNFDSAQDCEKTLVWFLAGSVQRSVRSNVNLYRAVDPLHDLTEKHLILFVGAYKGVEPTTESGFNLEGPLLLLQSHMQAHWAYRLLPPSSLVVDGLHEL